MPPDALELLKAKGNDLVQQIGIDVVRRVVLDVLSGKNLRDSTESLTRRRIATLNLGLLHLFLQGMLKFENFVDQLPVLATNILSQKGLDKSERWIAQWVLGLTDKGFQNILRDNPEALTQYRDQFMQTCQEAILGYEQRYGALHGNLQLGSQTTSEINWPFFLFLFNAIGAQTLTIRGSEKSAYGKLFEKLILGSLLHILGFQHILPNQIEELERVFWLSSQEERRESDATLLYEAGKGVRFDIGFIGRGNPEISLDKVTRFEREISLGRSQWYMATIIIVDRIGLNSRIERLAQGVSGTIVQMSSGYWPQQIAHILHQIFGFQHELVNMPTVLVGDYLEAKILDVPLEKFIGLDISKNDS